ncbi:MAG: Glucokinase [Candidatus Celerinatantimonas neptuna]|nr:MAG: Glucokinase [Candidatus Celerinatantimonas neptuna]
MADMGLIADVGGTNIRLALVDIHTGEINHIQKYLCAHFPGIEEAILHYLSTVECHIKDACIAIACPTDHDLISMTNHSWSFSQSDTKKCLNLNNFWVINDFTANAMSLPTLKDNQKIQIGGKSAVVGAPVSIYGPGTGLGVAHLVIVNGRYIPLSTEGGHVDFAPASELENEILSFLRGRFGHVSSERVLSGPGLVNIYQALCHINQHVVNEEFQPKDITHFGLTGTHPVCEQTLSVFCQIMGSFGGNLALTLGAFGGVYIAGGVIGNFLDYFLVSDFRRRFEEKGRFDGYCSQIPVYLITAKQPGLQGASAFLRQELGYRLES